MINPALFSSKTPEWETPQYLFDELNAEFGFSMDVCASKENAKCDKYFTKEENGLEQEWSGTIWCNPPYGREIKRWVKACHDYGDAVMLVPARTDTTWFHDYIYGQAEIRFIRGRLKFSGSSSPAPFPSMVVIFRRKDGQG